jgi:hypothetical protein
VINVIASNSGAVGTYATSISITWPISGGNSGQTLIQAVSSPGPLNWTGTKSGGSATFSLTSGAFPLGIPLPPSITFTYTFSKNFTGGTGDSDLVNTMTINPVPQGCNSTVGE